MWEVVLLLFVLAWLTRWVATGIGNRGPARLEPANTAELARLRDEVDQLTAQVARLQDEQSFMMGLLTDGKPADAAALPGPEPAPEPEPNPEIP